mgnify:CR=1 FL=1
MGMLEDSINKVGREYQTGNRNEGELVLGTAAAGARKVGDIIGTVADYAVPDALGIGETAADVYNYLANTQAGQKISEVNQQVKEAYPRSHRAASELFDVASVAAPVKGIRMKDKPTKGQALTEGDLYIQGYYRPADVTFSDSFEQRVASAETMWKEAQKMSPEEVRQKFSAAQRAEMNLLGRKSVDPKSGKQGNPVVDRMRTLYGFADWGLKSGARGVASILSPKARAMYAEYGVNKVDLEAIGRWKHAQLKYDELVKKQERGETVDPEKLREAKAAVPNALAMAQQQLQATANIRRQSGNQGATVTDMLDEVARSASDPKVLESVGTPYFPLKSNTDWFNDIVRPALDDKTLERFSPEDARVMQRHIFQAQRPRAEAEVIVKRASSKQTGKHWEDLFQNNTSLDPIADAFVQLKKDTGRLEFADNAELISYLSKQQKAQGKGKNFYIKFDDPNSPYNDNGIWITQSKTGTAKVEGAVNMLYRVDRDGNLIGMMSDKHDFLDGNRATKLLLDGQLPKDVVAITKPLSYSIFDSRATKFKKFDDVPKFEGETGKKMPARAKGERSFEGSIEDRLNTINELQPSAKEVSRQRNYLASKGIMMAPAAGMLTGAEEQ